jgi:hypothetical protein
MSFREAACGFSKAGDLLVEDELLAEDFFPGR